jgi:hypothetical protein
MRALDALQRRVPFRLPFGSEQVYITSQDATIDDSATRRAFGLVPRPLPTTFADTVQWLVRARRVSPGLAGRLAGAA